MSKHQTKPAKRLKARQDNYDSQSTDAQKCGKRPGSLNRKK